MNAPNRFTFASLFNWLYALVLVGLLALATNNLGETLRKGEFFSKTEGGETVISSYVQYYICGKFATAGLRDKCYDQNAQLEMSNEVIAPRVTKKIIFSQYVPYFFTLMIPFSMLPLTVSFLTWTMFCLMCGVFGLGLILREENKSSWTCIAVAIAGAAASLPSMLTWRFGQMTWLLIGLSAVYIWAFLKERSVVSGMFLAMTTFKPQYTVFLGIPALMQKKWKLVVASVVTELSLLALGTVGVGWNNLISYPYNLMKWDTQKNFLGVFPEKMISLRGPLTQWLPESAVHGAVISCVLLFLGANALMWYVTSTQKKSREWSMAITVLSMLIASPHTHIYDELLVFVAAALTLPVLTFPAVLRQSPLSFKLWCAIMSFYPVLSWLCYIALMYQGLLAFTQVLAINCILLALATACWFNSSSRPLTESA